MTGIPRIPALFAALAAGAFVFGWPQGTGADEGFQADAFEQIRDTLDQAPGSGGPGSPSRHALVEAALKDPFYTELLEALEAAGRLTPGAATKFAPVDRAMTQRKLWHWFDGLAGWLNAETLKPRKAGELSKCRELLKAIALLLQKTALSPKEIEALPDTVAATAGSGRFPVDFDAERPLAAYFPANLFDDMGPWVCLDKERHRLSATFHSEDKRWRSVFHIYMRLPGERADTQGYLATLREFEDQWTAETLDQRAQNLTLPHGGIHNVNLHPNPDTPQFPIGTQFALVEQVLLIDAKGELVMSPIAAKVQLRTYLKMDPDKFGHDRFPQAMAEFVLNWEKLAAGNPVLDAVGASETIKPSVAREEGPQSVARCMTCHSGWGIHSVNSRAQLFEPINLMTPRFIEGTREGTAAATVYHKRKDHTWGLLQGLWLETATMNAAATVGEGAAE